MPAAMRKFVRCGSEVRVIISGVSRAFRTNRQTGLGLARRKGRAGGSISMLWWFVGKLCLSNAASRASILGPD
eukprot:COSAG06_NODE_5709_length_3311_cov_2.768991_4_plen_73_part_00